METIAPNQLMAMPLHAITEMFGEPGLRERFRLQVDRLPEQDRDLVRQAAELAEQLHSGQRRVREPYLNHVLRVAIRIMCYYRIDDPEVIIAALLHDAAEDQPWRLVGRVADGEAPPVDAALAELSRRYGARVARLVAAVTNPEFDPDRSAHEQYREHLIASLKAEPWARVIKISDFTDNAVGIVHSTGPKVMKVAVKYAPMVPVLRELIARPDTPLADDVKQHVFEQLDLAQQRLDILLS